MFLDVVVYVCSRFYRVRMLRVGMVNAYQVVVSTVCVNIEYGYRVSSVDHRVAVKVET